jgi:hypothetical protein
MAAAIAIGSLLTLNVCADFGAAGGEYRPAGTLKGDQIHPALALNSSGGIVLWDDNTDGDGQGIRGRLLGSQYSGLTEPFNANTTVAGDQERPTAVTLADGSYFLAWQSGAKGSQTIVGRHLGRNGVFQGGEEAISGPGDHRGVKLAALGDGSVAATWVTRFGGDTMDEVVLAIVAANGSVGAVQTVNQTRAFNQRDPVVAVSGKQEILVAFASESVGETATAAVKGRLFGKNGSPLGGEFSISQGAQPAAAPALLATPAGWFVAWSQFNLQDFAAGWDVVAQALHPSGAPASPAMLVNARTKGTQVKPVVSAAGDDVLVAYESEGLDGFGNGIGARLMTAAGSIVGEEFAVNSVSRGDQSSPTVGSDADGRFLIVWATFESVANGLELKGQRLVRAQAPLTAPSAPYAVATSSSRLQISWPALEGLSVARYEVTVDGGAVPVSTAENSVALSGFAPGSAHTARLVYVLADGRRSPASGEVSVTMWGADDNADGLPDDWQARYFGPSPDAWPSPSVDSDGDGKSDREEFLAGTSPIDKASCLRTQLTVTPVGRKLSWTTIPGALYQIQTSTDMSSWSDFGGKRLATGSEDHSLIETATDSTYFRVNFLR